MENNDIRHCEEEVGTGEKKESGKAARKGQIKHSENKASREIKLLSMRSKHILQLREDRKEKASQQEKRKGTRPQRQLRAP